MPKACEKCGAENVIQAGQCSECGAHFGGAPMAVNESMVKAFLVLGLVLLVGGGLLWTAVFGGSGESNTPSNALDDRTCSQVTTLVQDVGNQLVQNGDLRGRLQDIYDDARSSGDEAIRASTRAALASATAADYDAVPDQLIDMAQACRDR